MVAHSCNPSTQQLRLCIEPQASLGFVARRCLNIIIIMGIIIISEVGLLRAEMAGSKNRAGKNLNELTLSCGHRRWQSVSQKVFSVFSHKNYLF